MGTERLAPRLTRLLLIFLCSSGLPVLGQELERPHVRAETFANLYELRVTDPQGNIVRGLRGEDFLVRDRGRRLEIRYFQESETEPICVAFLVDTGSSMSAEAISTSKDLLFRLVHLLKPEDEILLASYDADFHILSELTSDRRELSEGLWNLAPGGRSGKWRRLGNLFVSESKTGYSVDMALLKMKRCRADNKIVTVFSAGFGNIGKATLDHVQLAGARFFGVSFGSRLMDVFNLGGDQMARKRILGDSGGLAWNGETVAERIDQMRDALKHHYLLAFGAPEDSEDWNPENVTFEIRSRPDLQVHAGRKTRSGSPFY